MPARLHVGTSALFRAPRDEHKHNGSTTTCVVGVVVMHSQLDSHSHPHRIADTVLVVVVFDLQSNAAH